MELVFRILGFTLRRFVNISKWLTFIQEKEAERFILWVPVFLGIGVSLYFSLSTEPTLFIGVLFLPMLYLLWWCRNMPWSFILLALCLALLGFCTAQWRAHLLYHPMITTTYHEVLLRGKVCQCEHVPQGQRLLLDLDLSSPLKRYVNAQRVRLVVRSAKPEIQEGDMVEILSRLLPISQAVMPQGYDFRRQAYFQGIDGVGYSLAPVKIIEKQDEKEHGLARQGVRNPLENLRTRLTHIVRLSLPSQEGAVAAALITGDRAGITQKTNDAYNSSGLAHILSISGLHFSIVAGILFFIIRRGLSLFPYLSERCNIKKIAACAVVVASFAYMLLAGGGVPVYRSFLMIGCVMVAIMLDRHPISMRLVAFAATMLLLVTPEALLTASFQLSFAAVIALVAFYESKGRSLLDGYTGLWWKFVGYFLGIIVTTLLASLATAPLTLLNFNRFPVYSLVANILAVPLTGILIMPTIILTLILIPFGQEKIGFFVLKYSVRMLNDIAHMVSAWPSSVIIFPSLPPFYEKLFTLGIIFGGLWLCLWQSRWRWWGGGVACASFIWLFFVDPPDLLIHNGPPTVVARIPEGVVWVGKRNRFLHEQWLRYLGYKSFVPMPPQTSGRAEALLCRHGACLYHNEGRKIMLHLYGKVPHYFLRQVDGVVELAANPRKGRYGRHHYDTAQTVILSPDELVRNGPYALWVRRKGIRLTGVHVQKQKRLWSLPSEKKTER